MCEIEDMSNKDCGGVSAGLSVVEEELVDEDARRSGSDNDMSYRQEEAEWCKKFGAAGISEESV
jgi:hypothetical protein